ncbi:MAG: SRPBCC domain-containing protein [Verrucomicrobiae bacterium]|nr:SRPBCC domain-containing protein [Verrucomicrobiae bacterium]
MADPVFEKRIQVKAPAEAVWKAIVEPAQVEKYHFVPLRKIDLKAGGAIEYGTPEKIMISGKIVAIEPHRKLSHTFRFLGHENTDGDSETTVTYTLAPGTDGGTELTLIHSGFSEKNQTYENVTGGWPFLLDGLAAVAEGRDPGQKQ